MSLSNWIHKKNYLDLDYIYGTLANSNGEDPMDYETFAKNLTEFEVVCTDAAQANQSIFQKKICLWISMTSKGKQLHAYCV